MRCIEQSGGVVQRDIAQNLTKVTIPSLPLKPFKITLLQGLEFLNIGENILVMLKQIGWEKLWLLKATKEVEIAPIKFKSFIFMPQILV